MFTEDPKQVVRQGDSHDEAGGALHPKTITCHNCEREVPADSLHCPHCCGEDGRAGASRRGAFFGGTFGLLGGGVTAAIWTSVFGAEHNTWGQVSGIILACVLVGAVLGIISSRKE